MAKNQAEAPRAWAEELRNSIVRKATPESLKRAYETGEVAPRLLILRPGDEITVDVVALGPNIDINDRVTGEVKDVQTWHVRNRDPKADFHLRSTHQLSLLSGYVGHYVTILCVESRDIDGDRRVYEFVISDHGESKSIKP